MRYLVILKILVCIIYFNSLLFAQGYLRNDNVTTYTSGITLNEICANGSAFDYNADGVISSTSDKDEFVEIVNSSDQTINIGGWTLSDNTTTYLIFPDPTTINPGKSIVVYTYGADVSNFNPGNGNLVTATPAGIRLSNSDDVIGLKNTNGLYISVKWGTGVLPADFTTGATLVGTEVTISNSWTAGQSQSRNPDYSGSWSFHPTITGTVDWSVDHTVTLTDPQASPGRKYGLDQSLPVTLSSFQAVVYDGHVLLKWRTESEVENLGFEIYRSLMSTEGFQLLDSYRSNPALKGQINSSQAHDYQYEDYSVAAGQTYYYKLADVDLKGRRTFHGPIKVQVTQGDQNAAVSTSVVKNFRLYPNQPNPFNPSTTITFDVPQLEQGEVNLSINIFNLQGQKVRTLFSGALTGNAQYRLQWDSASDEGQPLPAGIYFVVLRARDVQQSIKVCLVK